MPADVSYENISYENIDAVSVDATPSRRLPLGLGLAIAACASGGLWFGVIAGVRALFF